MKPSSSPSDAGGLLAPLFGDARVDEAVSDAAFLQAMLDAEAALAQAEAAVGLVPRSAADAISAACRAGDYDLHDIGERALAAGNPVVPLVRDLTGRIPPAAAPYVHFGATSQDIIDTALSRIAKRALEVIIAELDQLTEDCAWLATEYRTVMTLGRTLLQQALPTTFGLKAAGWLSALDAAYVRLMAIRERGLAVQLGGAVGTLAPLGARGADVVREFAARLDLVEPTAPWHTDRTRIAQLATALGVAAGALGKIALDITLLAQSEVAEVSEGGDHERGGSSTMPHKQNPVGAVLVTATTRRAPHLVATLLASMPQEHERAAGTWHAEWQPLRDLLRVVGGAAAHCRELVAGLRLHPSRMRDNLDDARDLIMAESVAARLSGKLGRTAANELVGRLARKATMADTTLRQTLMADPVVRQYLDEAAIDAALDPENYLGSAATFVDRVLVHHQRIRERLTDTDRLADPAIFDDLTGLNDPYRNVRTSRQRRRPEMEDR